MLASLVEKIHASPFRYSLIVTGAGGMSIASLMAVPGCSRTLINAQVPYSPNVTRDILDHTVLKHVCPATGRQLAQHAFADGRAALDSFDTQHVVGIGATAAIQTDRERRSPDAAFVSFWGKDRVQDYTCSLPRNGTRAEQEATITTLILKAMADAAGIETSEEIALDDLQVHAYPTIPSAFQAVLAGQAKCALFNKHGEIRMDLAPFAKENYDHEKAIYLLYPGSFKPLHWGHTELGRVAGDVMQRYSTTKKPVFLTYEISASIVGKKDVCEADFQERIKQFTSQHRRVAITGAKLFVEKAEMFPNHGLIVGIDTARRVLDPCYYDNSEAKMIEAMKAIDSFGCYFVVGGRKHGEDWDDLSCLHVPEAVKHMFKGINPADFRVDISSTEIRARRMSSEVIDA